MLIRINADLYLNTAQIDCIRKFRDDWEIVTTDKSAVQITEDDLDNIIKQIRNNWIA